MLANLVAGLTALQGLGLIVVCGLVAGTLIAVITGTAAVRADAGKALAELDLKREMLDRGMSANEIALVMGKAKTDRTEDLPCASEAVVEWEGDWYPAYILKAEPGRFFVHYVGHDVSENEWVETRRVRLPAAENEKPNWTPSMSKAPAMAEV